MKLSELFNTKAMNLAMQSSEKNEALVELASLLVDGEEKELYVEALKEREAQSTTGVGEEIAIPHAQHEVIKKAAIVFGRKAEGLEWESFDEQPAKLFFMIAAPVGTGEHLQALAQLSSVLMQPSVKGALLKAQTPEEVVAIFAEFDEEPEEAEVEEVISSKDEPYILAVTACPTGIAHTFMAEEKLKQAAKNLGVKIKIETNGQAGINNKLTAKDIKEATAIIVAADKQVEMARFHEKPVIITKVADGINKAEELVTKAIHADAPIYHANHEVAMEELSENESFGRQFYKHLMNGVSHMLPFVVAGGILIALSFFWGINAFNPEDPSYNPMAQFFMTAGKLSFAMMLPMLAGFIGQSIADRPGLVIGFMGGIFANPGVISDFSGTGIFQDALPSGFLGALIAGFLAGGIVWCLKKAFAWLPKSLEGLKPIFIYPVLGVLSMAFLMLFVINGPMGAVMNGIMNFLNSIPTEWSIVLGFVVGAMMSIDMGGPINKAAYVTGTALVASSNGAGSDVMAAVMVGGMVPPLAIAMSATINKHLWSEEERSGALVNYVMGAAFITEGAIPFAASNPLKVIPSLALGAGTAGALSMLFNCVSKVPHGGLFAVLVGGVTNPLMYILSWIIGGIVGALLLNITLRKK
ncbi:PTS system, fructose-specific IIC component [Granulicatella balaenopterae]|uniref:PTS system, fructose-specific IIC component n=1 Tax=Granulicatella balaenopterae TaxID=137733 RepID=A0A1H9LHH2_9LACT|nr:fructose-specific PTS transporter subunit EIIC [Granulicatella balaenopterae]SER10565.1 PTS system, fructose-specific IIC component [Granulicatella balaenopterae]